MLMDSAREKFIKLVSFLPDDIIVNILSRVSGKTAIRCLLVCKGWKDLILGPDFADLHSKNTIHTSILLANRFRSRFDLFALDKWSELAADTQRSPIHSQKFSSSCLVVLSHAGLIVLKENDFSPNPAFVVLNPVRPNGERIKITLCEALKQSMIHGVYYHPVLKQYCSLWMMHESGPSWDQPKRIQYMILTLGSEPSLKLITNPFSKRVMKWGSNMLLVCGSLYWMLRYEEEGFVSEVSEKEGGGFCVEHYFDIMKFDIVSEEFMVIPSPLPSDDPDCCDYDTHLLDIDGILSLIQILPTKIKIWSSKDDDQGTKVWTNVEYTFKMKICFLCESVTVAVVDGKVGVLAQRGFFVYNIIKGTLKKYPKSVYRGNLWLYSHQMTLANLNNCKPAISLDLSSKMVAKNDEVVLLV